MIIISCYINYILFIQVAQVNAGIKYSTSAVDVCCCFAQVGLVHISSPCGIQAHPREVGGGGCGKSSQSPNKSDDAMVILFLRRMGGTELVFLILMKRDLLYMICRLAFRIYCLLLFQITEFWKQLAWPDLVGAYPLVYKLTEVCRVLFCFM